MQVTLVGIGKYFSAGVLLYWLNIMFDQHKNSILCYSVLFCAKIVLSILLYIRLLNLKKIVRTKAQFFSYYYTKYTLQNAYIIKYMIYIPINQLIT